MRSREWALLQRDWCPHIKGNVATDGHRGDRMEMERKMAIYQPRKGVLEERPCQHLDLKHPKL